MDYSETISKRVLETILTGATLKYRLTQSHGEYDFELNYRDGSEAAVEVTAVVDEVLAQTIGAIRSKRKGGPLIRAAICKKSWMIFPANGASINNIRANADQQLAKLEQEGVDRFFCVRRDFPSIQEVCCQLQITGGGVVHSGKQASIRIASPIGGGAVGASLAIEAGEREAWKDNNRRKLGAAKTSERHLVVYIGGRNGLSWTALTCFMPPPALPRIPAEITNLWLIGPSENESEFVAWCASASETWSSTRVVCAPETPIDGGLLGDAALGSRELDDFRINLTRTAKLLI
jgi:hypothetical protein